MDLTVQLNKELDKIDELKYRPDDYYDLLYQTVANELRPLGYNSDSFDKVVDMYLKRKSIKENRLRLQEGVSADNPYLPIGLDKYKKNTSAKGIVISVRDKDGEHELNKLYKTDDDLKKLIQEIERKYPTYYDISAIHDRNLIQAFENSVEEYKNKPKQKYTSAQLNKMR